MAITLIVVVIFVAVFTGCSNNKTAKEPTRKDSPQNKQIMAVVNQDIGVEYSSGTVNYSEEFIKTLDADTFKLVSSAAAEKGLKDGTYAGAIVFPASLSSNVLNINYKNPQVINLEYSISEKLDKANSDITYNRIADVYQTFNNKLSYAYINALMEEIELGQYNVKEIFNNDSSNLVAARKLVEGNYNVDFKEPVMPEKKPEFTEQNTEEYQSSGNSYAEEINRLFKSAYASAHQKASKDINTDLETKAIDDSVDNMKGMLSKIAKYLEDVVNFTEKYNTYVEDVEEYQKKLEEYESSVAKYRDEIDNYIEIEDPTPEQLQVVNEAKEDVENKKEEVDKAKEKIQDKSPEFSSDIILPTKDDTEAAGNGITEEVVKYKNLIRSQAARLTPDEMIKSAMDNPEASKTYKDRINEARDSFIKNAGNTSKIFNKIQGENRSKLDDAYSLNSKFMFDTVKVLNETNMKNHKALSDSVESFMKTTEANSKDTKTRLNSFQDMLSGAKVNGRVSSDVMKFLIQPIQLVEKNIVD